MSSGVLIKYSITILSTLKGDLFRGLGVSLPQTIRGYFLKFPVILQTQSQILNFKSKEWWHKTNIISILNAKGQFSK